jgi:secreted PhoX family phosphatase
VPPNTYDDVTTADGCTSDVVIRWGDPVVTGAPDFDANDQTPESAARQFGYNNDYVGVLPLAGRKHLLVTNHEYTNEEIMFPAGRYGDAAKRKIAIQSHGPLRRRDREHPARRAPGRSARSARRATTAGSPAPRRSSSTAPPPATPV